MKKRWTGGNKSACVNLFRSSARPRGRRRPKEAPTRDQESRIVGEEPADRNEPGCYVRYRKITRLSASRQFQLPVVAASETAENWPRETVVRGNDRPTDFFVAQATQATRPTTTRCIERISPVPSALVRRRGEKIIRARPAYHRNERVRGPDIGGLPPLLLQMTRQSIRL